MKAPISTSVYALAMLLYSLSCSSPVMAQQKNNLVYRHSGFGLLNKKYFLNDEKISKGKVAALLEKEDPEAYKVFNTGRILSITGTVLCFPAACFFIYGMFAYVLSGFEDNGGTFIAGVVGL